MSVNEEFKPTIVAFCCNWCSYAGADLAGSAFSLNGSAMEAVSGSNNHGGMVQVFIGAVTFGLITNILQLIGIKSEVQFIIQGAILLLAINLDRFKKR